MTSRASVFSNLSKQVPRDASPQHALRIMLLLVALLLGVGVLWLAWNRDAVQAWKTQLSPVAFFAAMTILPTFGMPLSPFFVAAGAIFGLRIGLLGSAVAVVSHCSLCYVIARGRFGERMRRFMDRFKYEIPNFEQEGGLRFAVIVKLTPGIPGALKNYVLGLSGVPFGVYLGVCLVAAAGYAIPLMALGESLFKHDGMRAVVVVLAVGVVGLGLWIWRRRVAERSHVTERTKYNKS
ncbi:MAG: hypothetical protein RL701_6422 [Pseudomonadota bacterium]